MKTRVVVIIEHPISLGNVTEENIKETFDEAGDIHWLVEVESIKGEEDS